MIYHHTYESDTNGHFIKDKKYNRKDSAYVTKGFGLFMVLYRSYQKKRLLFLFCQPSATEMGVLSSLVTKIPKKKRNQRWLFSVGGRD
ncbi:MAG: hypothetical protein II393_03515 [Cytophagales bacterium]|nr:hypothetical protein [Cytophagales bacterium]